MKCGDLVFCSSLTYESDELGIFIGSITRVCYTTLPARNEEKFQLCKVLRRDGKILHYFERQLTELI